MNILIILLLSVIGIIAVWIILIKRIYYKKEYALHEGEPKRLEVKWRGDYKKVIVRLDGNEVGTLNLSKDEILKHAQSLILPDGSNLHVKFGIKPTIWSFEFTIAPEITLNDKPIPGSVNDPVLELNVASIYFILGGVSNIFFGVIILFGQMAFFSIFFLFPIGLFAIIIGIYIRRRSRSALNIGIGLAIFSALALVPSIFISLNLGESAWDNLFDVVSFVIEIIGLQKGFAAVNLIENKQNQVEKPQWRLVVGVVLGLITLFCICPISFILLLDHGGLWCNFFPFLTGC